MLEAIEYIIYFLVLGIPLFLFILLMLVVSGKFASCRSFPKPDNCVLTPQEDKDGFNMRISGGDVRTALKYTLILLAVLIVWIFVDFCFVQ